MPQFPLEMGQQKTSSNALVLKTDQDGRIRYDELVRQGHSKDRIIYSKFTDLLPKTIDDNDEDLRKPTQDVIEETTEKTRKALESLVEQKVAAAAPVRRAEKTAPAEYIRYTPTQQGLAFNSGAKQRLVRMVEMQKDPMEPPRFKINQKIPRGPPSPPPPLMHSPARKVTVKEQQDWKIPPCISNWKNPRGYTIPLDKRVAADGRGLQTVHINENFAKLAEALYTADRKAREAVEMRAQIERKVAQKQKERKEEQLQRIAHHAREFRAGLRRPGLQPDEELDADLGLDDREELRRDRARERVRERNLARSNIETKARAQKDKERDISEQIALGLPNPRVNADGEAQFDQRLFNQSRGLDSGFSGGADDLYNVYDKPWLGDSELASHIYRPRQKDSDAYGTDLDALQKTRRFVPDREFAGADHGRRLDGPVQFERDEEDPFNLSKFLSEAKKAQKRPGENISTDVLEGSTSPAFAESVKGLQLLNLTSTDGKTYAQIMIEFNKDSLLRHNLSRLLGMNEHIRVERWINKFMPKAFSNLSLTVNVTRLVHLEAHRDKILLCEGYVYQGGRLMSWDSLLGTSESSVFNHTEAMFQNLFTEGLGETPLNGLVSKVKLLSCEGEYTWAFVLASRNTVCKVAVHFNYTAVLYKDLSLLESQDINEWRDRINYALQLTDEDGFQEVTVEELPSLLDPRIQVLRIGGYVQSNGETMHWNNRYRGRNWAAALEVKQKLNISLISALNSTTLYGAVLDIQITELSDLWASLYATAIIHFDGPMLSEIFHQIYGTVDDQLVRLINQGLSESNLDGFGSISLED
ncbi:hypothetical protein CRM22_003527 [Opisthorchis felineus]|uniref:SKI-interacting protein SKIP SNW domain-containing protein n=1 Tax=Opisthorchis felineus TaxID=147828 RepID=A0A4S2M0T0_OPIFE|nr:hypothetical protein CRM22_003527 [Opisthorchis felineus]